MPDATEPSGSIVRSKLEREAFARLREVVLAAGGIDLDLYKDRCVLRRIAVRQRACGAADLRQYLRVVGRDAAERERLVKALTIHVSQFFRNPATFDAIRSRILPDILSAKRKSGGSAVRFWSAGCACGEEAYSLAILLLEADQRARERFSYTVYGSDIDPGCLQMAERGAYRPASLAQVSPQWRARYFRSEGGQLWVVPELRRMVHFRLHDVLTPSPFQRIDLLLFRNVLIYMSEGLQQRVVTGLHETLGPGGFLVLGKVESLPEGTRHLFEPVNVPERVYRRLETGRPPEG